MTQIKKKTIAQELRKKGYSIGEIAQELKMQKSGSISKWCQNIFLSSRQLDRLVKKQNSASYKGRMKFLENLRVERVKEVLKLKQEGIEEISTLSKRDFFIAGIAMYWSEGYKYLGGEQVGFTNSDPKMILFFLKWLNDICGISDDRITLQIKINKIHKERVKKVKNYWTTITKIPISQFNKTVLINVDSKKDYPNFEKYYGTLRVTVRKSTQLRRKIMGWIEGLGSCNQAGVVQW